jgi:hypothetical protein
LISICFGLAQLHPKAATSTNRHGAENLSLLSDAEGGEDQVQDVV